MTMYNIRLSFRFHPLLVYLSMFHGVKAGLPRVILVTQVHPDIACTFPFLSLHENKKMMLSPLLFLHQEAPTPSNSIPWSEVPCAASKMDFPLMKWVHVGCEVCFNL